MDKKLVSVIIPAYNEEKNVSLAYQAVLEVFEGELKDGYDFEIVFTDNHSSDATFVEIEKIAKNDPRVRAVSFTRNFGFNRSLITGYRLARGDAAIQMDCDLQDPPSVFPKFLQEWEKGHDVVVGIREKREEAAWLLKCRKIFYRFLCRISSDNLVIDGGDFRLVDRHILDSLRKQHDTNPYVRGLVSVFAKNQTGFAYERRKREHGASKFPFRRLVLLAVDGIVSHSTLPLRLASILGFVVAVGTVVLGMAYFVTRLFFELDWPQGFATTTLLQLFSISLNAIFLGIIGEYLGRIYQQLKDHPVTVIQKQINL